MSEIKEIMAVVEDNPAFPTDEKAEWDKDHKAFVLNVLIPMFHPRERVKKVLTWAYESGMEKRSNGSNVVPDWICSFANIKDPSGVGHDYLFELHEQGKADPEGHVWGLTECNVWYRQCCWDFHRQILASVRFVGLTLGSWWPWYFGKRRKAQKED